MLARVRFVISRTTAYTLLGLVLAVTFACGSSAAAPVDGVIAEEVANVVGVPDRGMDPSVVAIVGADGDLCSGVLLASDVALTALRCVSSGPPILCPSAPGALVTDDPAMLHVYTEVPSASVSWASSGLVILTPTDPDPCGADIAVLLLATPITGIPVGVVSEAGIADGSHVRTVSFAALPQGLVEALREHVPVLDVSATELAVGEATCMSDGGGVAIDETTGDVVGILSRPGSGCGAAAQIDIFTRTDPFYPLVLEGLAWQPALVASGLDGGSAHDAGKVRDAGRSKKPTTDVGSACLVPTDCAAGICVTAEGSQFCSRTCGPTDRCPTDFKCAIAQDGQSVCIEG